jgi:hypothetical protein
MNTSGHSPDIHENKYALYQEAAESKGAKREIEAIARDLARPPEEIANVYTELYADLRAHARVTDYVRVFAARKVRARFQQPHPADR